MRQLMIYAGKESEAVGLVDVSQVARGMIELLKVSISKHAVLVTDFGEDLPAVRGSTGEIQQIVMNLPERCLLAGHVDDISKLEP